MPNNTQQQAKMNIKLDDLQTIACPNCANSIFATNLTVFKKLLSIQSPTGQAQLIRIELIHCPVCDSCYVIKDGELFPVENPNK